MKANSGCNFSAPNPYFHNSVVFFQKVVMNSIGSMIFPHPIFTPTWCYETQTTYVLSYQQGRDRGTNREVCTYRTHENALSIPVEFTYVNQ
jgi:hypothetical protein